MTHTHSKQGKQSYNYLSIDNKHTIVSKGEINLSNMKSGTVNLDDSTGALGEGDYFKSDGILGDSIEIKQKVDGDIGKIIKTIEKDSYIINVHQTGDNNVMMIKHPKTAGRPSFKKMLLIMTKEDIKYYL